VSLGVVVERDQRVVERFEEAGEPPTGTVENEHVSPSLAAETVFQTFHDETGAIVPGVERR
jgi:hypothetical protein